MNTKSIIRDLHAATKSIGYFAISLFAAFVILSNSFTAVFKTIWSDVGNNWAVAWQFLEQHFTSTQLFFLCVGVWPAILYWIVGLLFSYHDYQAEKSSLSRYKIQPFKNQPPSRETFCKAVFLALFNQIVVSGIVIVIFYYVSLWRGNSTTLPLPDFNTFLLHMGGFLLVEELFFYYSHRLLHSKRFYGPIHKLHHNWQAPISISAIYAHPVEHLFSNLIPLLSGPVIMGSHLAVVTVWLSLAIMNTLYVHSGYHLPFLPSPEAHDFHHLRFNENFGVLGLLDYIHGTDRQFRQSRQFQQHRVYFTFDDYPDNRAFVPVEKRSKSTKTA